MWDAGNGNQECSPEKQATLGADSKQSWTLMVKLREVLAGGEYTYIYKECPTQHRVKTDEEMRGLRVPL